MAARPARRLSLKWLVLWSVWAARLVPQRTPPVRVAGGELRGLAAPDGSHTHYSGIPYATVIERFQAPGPPPTWDGVFDAEEEHIQCQQSVYGLFMRGQRDCLVLNVYTPLNTDPHAKLPVMFFIHGGGFFAGSGEKLLYGPRYLVKKGIILVTINYRLDVLGFLCLGIKEAPGNAGNKDQVAALRWVKENIRAFGGDPDRVTVFGESAGGASVSYLMLSPLARGLFHRAAIQSGSSLAPWAYQYRPTYIAGLLAKTMLHHTEDPRELYDLFNDKSDEELILTKVPRQEGNIMLSEILYSPCAEKVIEGVDPFLTESPIDILKKGTFNKVPVLMGGNTAEGNFFFLVENKTTLSDVKRFNFHKALPKSLDIPSEVVGREIGETLKKYYFGEDGNRSDMLNLVKIYEAHLLYPTLEEVEWIVKASDQPVYCYIFNYYGWRSLPSVLATGFFGQNASHTDDLLYLFSQDILPSFFEDSFIDKITTLWTNFAKYGDPTPEGSQLGVRWPPVTVAAPTALLLDEPLASRPLLYSPALRYLRHVYSKYRRR